MCSWFVKKKRWLIKNDLLNFECFVTCLIIGVKLLISNLFFPEDFDIYCCLISYNKAQWSPSLYFDCFEWFRKPIEKKDWCAKEAVVPKKYEMNRRTGSAGSPLQKHREQTDWHPGRPGNIGVARFCHIRLPTSDKSSDGGTLEDNCREKLKNAMIFQESLPEVI